MNCRDRLIKLLQGEKVDRPPFMPAIYDLKPVFIDAPLHTFGQDEGGLIRALSYEAEKLKMESLTVAYDIYNVEAEAAGCRISRDQDIGMPEISAPLIQSFTEIKKLKVPGEISERMALFVNAAQKLQQKYGDILPVRAGISGPFSVAAKIAPQDDLLMDTILHPQSVVELLKYTTQIVQLYAKSLQNTGAGIVVFDSFISPPMLSPEIYRDLVLPFHQKIFGLLKENSILQRTLIAGGNTTEIIPDLVRSGATQLLLDYDVPLNECKDIMKQYPGIVFRVNIPPALFVDCDILPIKKYIHQLLNMLGDCRNLIVGTGILPPNAVPSFITKAKEIIVDYYR